MFRILPLSDKLPDVLRAIERAFRDIMPAPFRTQQLETADLPAAVDHRGGIVYDLTAGTLKLSDGADWEDIFAGTVTAFAESLLDDPDAATARSTLGLGTIATQDANAVALTGGTISGMASISGVFFAGSGIFTWGTGYANLNIDQPLNGERYLLLVPKNSTSSGIYGTLCGRRNASSGSGENMGELFVMIGSDNSGTWVVNWQARYAGLGVTVRLVELTFGGVQWYALDAGTTGASASFDRARFNGYVSLTGDVLTWLAPGSVSGVTAVGNNSTVDFGGRATLTSSAFGCISSTTASAANVHQASSGAALLRSTSSIRYKTDVQVIPPAEAISVVRGLQAITYRSLSENDDPDWRWPGFIAEDVASVCPHLVQWRPLEPEEEPIQGAPTIEVGGETLIPESVLYGRVAAYHNVVLNHLLDSLEA